MTWAVFNLHSPAVKIDDTGCYSLGGPPIKSGEPIFTSCSKQEAEEERTHRQLMLKEGSGQ